MTTGINKLEIPNIFCDFNEAIVKTVYTCYRENGRRVRRTGTGFVHRLTVSTLKQGVGARLSQNAAQIREKSLIHLSSGSIPLGVSLAVRTSRSQHYHSHGAVTLPV